jgi:hypothetical protein
MRETTLKIVRSQKYFIALKVPRQCPLLLQVKYFSGKVKHWEVKKVKRQGVDFDMSRRKLKRGFTECG